MSIPGLPSEACDQVLAEIQKQTPVQRVVLYGSRAFGRYRSGSDVDLCLTAPAMTPAHLQLGAQLDHLISHEGLRDDIQRTGVCRWQRHQNQGITQNSNADLQ